MKNKPIEEIIGYEKATQRRNMFEQKVHIKRRNHTYAEFYGIERADEVRRKISISNKERAKSMSPIISIRKNKTLEEIYSIQKATEIKKKQSISRLGKIPWNKNLTKETDIRIYKYSEKMKGPINPSWIDGRSFKPYGIEFTKDLKRKIRQRDSNFCQLCFKELEILSVHHIDYNKENSGEMNLITLCISCNSKVNKNREYWENYFSPIGWEILLRNGWKEAESAGVRVETLV